MILRLRKQGGFQVLGATIDLDDDDDDELFQNLNRSHKRSENI